MKRTSGATVRRPRSRRWLPWAAIPLALLAAGILAVLVHTPTITVYVRNDTPSVVRVTVCGSDPQTARPEAVVAVDPNPHDPRAACLIYEGTSDRPSGCLFIPTTRVGDGDTVRVSAMVKGVRPDRCGD